MCAPWSFDRKGVIIIDNEDEELDEDTVMMDALEAGAVDIKTEGSVFRGVLRSPDDFSTVNDALSAAGYKFLSAQIEMVPQNYVKLTDPDDIKNFEKMLDLMEDNDDVQNVWHNSKRVVKRGACGNFPAGFIICIHF